MNLKRSNQILFDYGWVKRFCVTSREPDRVCVLFARDRRYQRIERDSTDDQTKMADPNDPMSPNVLRSLCQSNLMRLVDFLAKNSTLFPAEHESWKATWPMQYPVCCTRPAKEPFDREHLGRWALDITDQQRQPGSNWTISSRSKKW